MKLAAAVGVALALAVPASAAEEPPTLAVDPSVIGRTSGPLVFHGTA